VKHASFIIERQCRQCGAPVSLEETDRIFVCPFCRVRHFIYNHEYLRYFLPPLPSIEAEIVYVPYWRIKGLKLIISGNMTKSDFVDRTFCAIPPNGLPLSLGLATRTLKMKFVEPETPGRFEAPATPITKFLITLSIPSETWAYHSKFYRDLGKPVHERGIEISKSLFIGEIASLIYAPFFIRGETLFDGISGHALPEEKGSSVNFVTLHGNNGVQTSECRNPRSPIAKTVFVPAMCPDCGWDLHGGKDSLMMECGQCRRFWRPTQGELEAVEFSVSFSMPKADLWVPLWRMEIAGSNVSLGTRADFHRLVGIPRSILPVDENEPFFFWTPAFKSFPDLFLRIGKIFSMRQEPIEKPLNAPSPLHPVTLSVIDALQRFPALLAELAPDRRKIIKIIKTCTFQLKSASLVFVPFIDEGMEYSQPNAAAVIFKDALLLEKNQ
jgi:hypothetical protein